MCTETKMTRPISVPSFSQDGKQSLPSRLKGKSNDFLQENNTSSSSFEINTKRTSIKVPKKVRFEIETRSDDRNMTNITSDDHTKRRSCSQSFSLSTVYPVKPASDMTDSEKKNLYWQEEDYNVFKGGAQFVAREIRRRDVEEKDKRKNRYSNSINNIYYMSVLLANNSLASEDVSLLNEIPSHLLSVLTYWAKVGHARRGLERLCVEFHAERRYTARNMLIKSVLQAQQILNEQHAPSLLDSDSEEKRNHTDISPCSISEEEKVNILRKVSERYSRQARLFGEVMGHADAAALESLRPELAVRSQENVAIKTEGILNTIT